MLYTLLAVDDEPANLRMLERLFRKEFRVLTASNGEEALDIIRQEEVSLIITDQRMPGMSGTQFLRKTLNSNPDTVRIILTGFTDVDALTDAINTTRVYQFVSKPWDPLALKQIVEDAMREHERSMEQKRLLEGLLELVRSCPHLFGARVAGLAPENGAADDSVSFNISAGKAN
ncbi:MAG TPA: response regulator [Blastocatellia bacterium]|nr:response regulator [Blastocatellia bacterium]